MKGLFNEIESALKTTIKGLEYDFFSGFLEDEVDAEKMKSLAKSKLNSLAGAKKMIDKWIDSPNKPSDKKLLKYVNQIIEAGESSITTLRIALDKKIDFDNLEPHKHAAALDSKPVLLEAILDIDSELIDLRDKIENNDLTFKEREFKLGLPEIFAKGEIVDRSNYYKKRLTEDGSVIIDPHGTEGKKLVIDDLGIILPQVPDDSEILFSDLPKEEQYWRRIDVPNITTSNIEDHVKFTTREFKRRLEGVWFYNNGVPTYLTGHHYFALQYCKMLDSGGFMNYREAQRDLFYFMEACLVDNRSLGMLFGKSRRTGFTYCAICAKMNRATSTKNTKHGLMSKTGEDGKEAFAKESYMFLNLPFWFRPIVRGKLDSPKELYFGQPADNSKEKKKSKEINIADYLNTSMDFRNTKNGSYDSIKLDTYILDEVFKIEAPNDVITHLGMVAPTMIPNGRVVGKMLAGSTMGIHSKGGEQGIELIEGSKVSERDPVTKKTSTALYFHFLPAHKNMEEFTDKYGKCWDEKPDKEVYNVFGDLITGGAYDYLLALEAQKRKQSEKAYNEQIRTYPRTIEHMMRDESTECVFNMEKINEQIEHNRTLPEESKYVVGNFEWVDGVIDGDVRFIPSPRGRFKVAWLPSKVDDTDHLQNRVKEVNGKYYPLNLNHVRFGCDPFSFSSTVGQGSDGALHGKTMHIPDDGIPKNKFILEYLERPSGEIFLEDIIKCIRFYGAPILIEANTKSLLTDLYNRGYRGFCMNRVDKIKKDIKGEDLRLGGQMLAGENVIDAHKNSIGTWIEDYTGIYTDDIYKKRIVGEMGEMPFDETLKQWIKFDPKNRTKFDAVISSGLAIMACQESKYKPKSKNKPKLDIGNMLNKYSPNGQTGVKIR